MYEFIRILKSSVDAALLLGPRSCSAVMPRSLYQPYYDSLICGQPLPAGQEKQWIIDTGVIHLIVVSGLHLLFIERWLRWLPNWLRLGMLTLYAWLTGLQAPVMRALLRRIGRPWWREHFGLTGLQAEATGVAIALLFCPAWLWSRSFLMSWMGALAIFTPFTLIENKHVDRALKAYVLLLPFCWASPLTLLWTILFVPFVGLVLFPVAVLAVLIPWLTPIADAIWRTFFLILSLGPQSPPLPVFFPAWQLCWLPVSVHLIFLVAEVQWRRRSALS